MKFSILAIFLAFLLMVGQSMAQMDAPLEQDLAGPEDFGADEGIGQK